MQMTSRARMLAAIHHDRVDRVPVSPWGLGRLDPQAILARQLISQADPWLEVGLGCNAVWGSGLAVEDERQGNKLRRVLHTPQRDLVAVYTTTSQTTACTEHLCKTPDDIQAFLALPYRQPHPDIGAWRAHKAWVGDAGLAVMGLGDGLCFPNDTLGTETCSLLWASEPELICSMVATAAERIYRAVEEACLAGVDCFRIVGGEYATQLMGPRAWDELVVPYDKPLVDLIHRHGGIAHYHNHGNMQRFIARIAELGIDSLDPIEQPPYGDIAMGRAQELIGERVCLVGGLDDMEILDRRSRSDVLRLGGELLQSLRPEGFMLGGTSSGIYGEKAAGNFLALVELAQCLTRGR